MDFQDRIRWIKRNLDVSISYRKIAIIAFFVFAFILYVGPYIFRLLTAPSTHLTNPIGRCLSDRLMSFSDAASNFDANIRHYPLREGENAFIPYVEEQNEERLEGYLNHLRAFSCNGKIGVVVENDGMLYLKSGRVLSVAVPFRPVVLFNLRGATTTESSVVDYMSGMVHKFHCLFGQSGIIDVHYAHYAHRSMPALYIQDIKVTNPSADDIYFDVQMPGVYDRDVLKSETISLDDGSPSEKFPLITGQVPLPDNSGQFLAVAIITSQLPRSLTVRQQSTESVVVLTSVHYMGPVTVSEYKDAIEEAVRQARSNFSRALKMNVKRLKEDHRKVWQQLWSSGFGISYSRATNALNGDKINATIYYVLSHTRSPLHDVDIAQPRRLELGALLSRPDRCYEGHDTLQAPNLWSDLSNVDDVIRTVSLWKLTLDKQGCHTMLHAGADGAMQAILLSLGALKFSNHHLEFCSHPRDLHRDFTFRRINYGNATHVNISVIVGEDNKAALYVALDRSDKNYYACDGGCLDPPIQLGTYQKQFPVKLTDPPTAILYITADKQHMEELKHAIHVKEVIEAPAHEHHIIALHRHGHHLGGLPTLFWVSIAILVLVFHLFLFKLIYNEYCTGNLHHEKIRARYAL